MFGEPLADTGVISLLRGSAREVVNRAGSAQAKLEPPMTCPTAPSDAQCGRGACVAGGGNQPAPLSVQVADETDAEDLQAPHVDGGAGDAAARGFDNGSVATPASDDIGDKIENLDAMFEAAASGQEDAKKLAHDAINKMLATDVAAAATRAPSNAFPDDRRGGNMSSASDKGDKLVEELAAAIKANHVDPRSSLEMRRKREMTAADQQEYKGLRTHAERDAFRVTWASKTYETIVSRKQHDQSYSVVDVSKGVYMAVAMIATQEGGDEEAYRCAVRYALKRCRMGANGSTTTR